MAQGNKLVFKGLSDKGQMRELNEDSFGTPRLMGMDEEAQAKRGVLLAVADGMGGHAAGEIASRMAVETLFKSFSESHVSDPGRALTEAYTAANRVIHEFAAGDPAHTNMGTTLVAAVVKNGRLWIANVGDSRAYLVHGKRIEQVTRDHSWVAEQLRAKVLTEPQAQRHIYKHLITRALGTQPEVKVDLFSKRLHANDTILLCSDGLTNYVEPRKILEVVNSAQDPVQVTEKLVALANGGGGDDNITVIAARVIQGSSPLPSGIALMLVATAFLLGAALTARVVLTPVYIDTLSATPAITQTVFPSPTPSVVVP